METRRVLQQVGAITAAAGTVVAGTVVDAEPVAGGASDVMAPDGWASLADRSSAATPAGAEPLCFRIGEWTGPKRVSAGAIRGEAGFGCARPQGAYWLWEAVLQRKAGDTWQGYSEPEYDICKQFGQIDICEVTDGGPYRAGTYRIRATLAYGGTGGHAYVYSPAVTIR